MAIGVPEIVARTFSASWCGVAGFVPRSGSIDDMVSVIEKITRGDTVAPSASDFANGEAIKADFVTAPAADLTPRESEILAMIELGLSNKEIARNLRIEVGTVKNHVHNLLEKLNVRRRNEAAHRLRSRLPSA